MYVQADTVVCDVWYSDLLASPEKFYGRKIYTGGYLVKGAHGVLLLPFKDTDSGAYEKIYIAPRPASQAYGMLNNSHSASKLEQGMMVGMVGTFEKAADSQRPALGRLDDVYLVEL